MLPHDLPLLSPRVAHIVRQRAVRVSHKHGRPYAFVAQAADALSAEQHVSLLRPAQRLTQAQGLGPVCVLCVGT